MLLKWGVGEKVKAKSVKCTATDFVDSECLTVSSPTNPIDSFANSPAPGCLLMRLRIDVYSGERGTSRSLRMERRSHEGAGSTVLHDCSACFTLNLRWSYTSLSLFSTPTCTVFSASSLFHPVLKCISTLPSLASTQGTQTTWMIQLSGVPHLREGRQLRSPTAKSYMQTLS